MQCPYCRRANTDVVETRVSEDTTNIRRRRVCGHCGKRFTTYERIENVMLFVKKKDGRREQFNREKLLSGVIRACEKTNISTEEVRLIVDKIEQELRNEDTVEIESRRIGQLVSMHLKKLDKVAYIRFSSVFKRFVDLEDFEKELKRLIK